MHDAQHDRKNSSVATTAVSHSTPVASQRMHTTVCNWPTLQTAEKISAIAHPAIAMQAHFHDMLFFSLAQSALQIRKAGAPPFACPAIIPARRGRKRNAQPLISGAVHGF
jgi:hypothetical protein